MGEESKVAVEGRGKGGTGDPHDPDRHRIYAALQTLLAGEPRLSAIAALADSLAAGVGTTVETPQQAQKILRQFSDDMYRSVLNNWDYYQSLPSEMSGEPGHGGM
ncbi:hypothetical protein [Afifella sp. YEN Y35]|uniref:hypothetical protein n=1 Tax=Afifella sp. YEN Y35 TaxID=3388337 RepID=UPI0039DF8112